VLANCKENKKMTAEKWSIDELVALVEEVQTGEVIYSSKSFSFQWCELTEAEEPKVTILSPNASEDDKADWYAKVGTEKIIAMIDKANDKNPEGISITGETWTKLPATLRYTVTAHILDVKEDSRANFING
tara:strand:+ start:6568 stop:6960 length:393 start_codon:yes stop_codon:yes gene_type:complete